jgi:putative membrane protein
MVRMKNIPIWFLKGFIIGSFNLIPGVSGSTVALITGIFERLVHSVKAFNLNTFKLLINLKIKSFIKKTDLFFLISVLTGITASIFSLAKGLAILFDHYPVFIWSFIFGLILTSIYFVARTIEKFNFYTIILLLLGTVLSGLFCFLTPAIENNSIAYIILCGILAIIGLIVPGLSFSFILILTGNYQLIMIRSVNEMNFAILLPFIIGILIGLPLLSNALSWIYKKYKNSAIALLTGFIAGSLLMLWPWKYEKYMIIEDVEIFNSNGLPVITGYERYIPDSLNIEVLISFAAVLTGILSFWLIEKISSRKKIKQ